MLPLILASSSPRRQELLAAAGYAFSVMDPRPDSEDEQRPAESPAAYVVRMARQKAADAGRQRVYGKPPSAGSVLILGCDTVVVCNGQILGKPAGRHDARAMLRTLRGTEHYALSGVCLGRWPEGDWQERVVSTTLRMAEISDCALEEYLDSGLWQGKAGGFGYQDRTGWLEIVSGSDTNVVGLPMETIAKMLDDRAG